MKALILGLGVSGQSVSNFLMKEGAQIACIDDKTAINSQKDLRGFDLFVPSPGIARDHPLYRSAIDLGIEIAGEAELALRRINQRCVAVTGTNGKTTVVMLIEHCLKFCGKKAIALGNIGTPISSYLDNPDPDEILVVELSSFQLETLSSKAFDVGLILNIAEDHLDRYEDYKEYAKTKASLQNCLKKEGKLFVHSGVEREFFRFPFETFDSNEEAAFKALEVFGVTKKEFQMSLKTFSKPPHRLEFVAEIDGAVYYNDSKATNVAAVVNALEKMTGNVILLAGGKDKHLSFSPLAKYSGKISCLLTFGQAREKIAKTLEGCFPIEINETMEQATLKAMKKAGPNHVVLFSPGCSSMDAFENYSKRGEAFKNIVKGRSI